MPDDYFHYDGEEADSTKMTNKLALYSLPTGVDEYTDARLYVDGEKLELYSVQVNTQHSYQTQNYTRSPVGVGFLRLKGKADVIVHLPYDIDYNSTVAPAFYNITPIANRAKRTLKFTIKAAGQYAITVNNDMTKVIYLFVDDYDEGAYEKKIDSAAADVLYFGPGIHDKNNDPRISEQDEIWLSSGQTLYLDYRAVVRAKIRSYGAENIRIIGGGVIDGSTFERNADTGAVSVPLELTKCRGVEMAGVSFLDPAGWTMSIYFCDGVKIGNIKIISSRANGDGISVQSSQNVAVERTFIRSFDDSLVVKNYPDFADRNIEGTTRNISFKKCVIWTDLAQSMEVGYETVGEVMEDILFEDIVVLHNFHKAPISIHNSNNADIKRVTFKNITIEDASMGQGDGQNVLVDFSVRYSPTWSNGHKVTGLGSVQGVTVENVTVLNASNANQNISLAGSVDNREQYQGSVHKLSDVTFRDFEIIGSLLTEGSPMVHANSYVENLRIETSGKAVTGGDLPLQADIASYGRAVVIEKF